MGKEDPVAWGQRMRRLRLALPRTLKDIAAQVGRRPNTLSRWERGVHQAKESDKIWLEDTLKGNQRMINRTLEDRPPRRTR